MVSITEANPHIITIRLNLYHGISSNNFIKTVNSYKDCKYDNAFTFSFISVALHQKKKAKKKSEIEKACCKTNGRFRASMFTLLRSLVALFKKSYHEHFDLSSTVQISILNQKASLC